MSDERTELAVTIHQTHCACGDDPKWYPARDWKAVDAILARYHLVPKVIEAPSKVQVEAARKGTGKGRGNKRLGKHTPEWVARVADGLLREYDEYVDAAAGECIQCWVDARKAKQAACIHGGDKTTVSKWDGPITTWCDNCGAEL